MHSSAFMTGEEDGNLQETKQSTFLTVTRPPAVVRNMVNDSLETEENGTRMATERRGESGARIRTGSGTRIRTEKVVHGDGK